MVNTILRTASMWRRARAAGRFAGLLLILAAGPTACSPERIAGSSLPPDIPDPAASRTPAGAVAAYRGALMLFRNAFAGDYGSFVPVSGLLSDELQSADVGVVGNVTDPMLLDSRTVAPDLRVVSRIYDLLQQARGQAEEAHGLMATYASDSAALLGHLDALQGYTEVYLADFFCSGIPLSTLDYGGNWTYKPGSTSAQVYAAAAALFDTAQTLAADSDRILNFARVGKGRSLLALGQYAAAAQAVAAVPDGFRYAVDFSTAAVSGPNSIYNPYPNRNFMWVDVSMNSGWRITMADREGQNGMPFVSSGDPRTASGSYGANFYGYPIIVPAKYDTDGDSSVVVASGVEARLIQAEAALQVNAPSWLTTLNALRTDGTYDTVPDPNDSTRTDTLWHAGTGGVAGLAPVADPGTQGGRVDLLFRERAYWLYLTGERQGDLRRLIRQYGRGEQAVYPTGSYPGAYGTYGADVNAPVPSAEKLINPLFTGCVSRGG